MKGNSWFLNARELVSRHIPWHNHLGYESFGCGLGGLNWCSVLLYPAFVFKMSPWGNSGVVIVCQGSHRQTVELSVMKHPTGKS